jgi:hypothetical protein
VSRCRVCGRSAEQVLSPAEVLQAAALILEARRRGVLGVPVLDLAASVLPSRLAALQVIECLATLLDRRDFVAEELARSVEVAELDELWGEPAAEGPES